MQFLLAAPAMAPCVFGVAKGCSKPVEKAGDVAGVLTQSAAGSEATTKEQLLTNLQKEVDNYKTVASSMNKAGEYMNHSHARQSFAIVESDLQKYLEELRNAVINEFRMFSDVGLEVLSKGLEALWPTLESALQSSSTEISVQTASCVFMEACTSDMARQLYNVFRFFNEPVRVLRDEVNSVFGSGTGEFDTNNIAIRSGKISASMTLLQALWRELAPGETRDALIRRVGAGVSRRPMMKPHACVQTAIEKVAGPQSTWGQVAKPPALQQVGKRPADAATAAAGSATKKQKAK